MRFLADENVDADTPSVIIVHQRAPIAQCIDDLMLIQECGVEAEYDGQVMFLPL